MFVGLARHIGELTRHFHIGGIFWKTHRHIVGLKAHRRFDVFHVFGSQCRRSQSAALFVDAFVVGQLSADFDDGVHLLALHRFNRQHNQTIVEQQQIARFHVTGQFFVIETYATQVSGFGARCVQDKFFTIDQHHFAIGKLADADLGAL